MKRRIWIGTTVLCIPLALGGCGNIFNPGDLEGDLARSYLGKMDEVVVTPRAGSGTDASSSEASGQPTEGGSIEDHSGNPVEARIELTVPSVQIDMEPAPETANSAHLFAVRTQVIGLRTASDIRQATLDLRLIRKKIGITDILRYLHIDEQAVLADLRQQLQNQLREIFLRSFLLELTQTPGAEPTTHSPTEARFECAFHKHGFDGSEFAGAPVTCTAELFFGDPVDPIRVMLRGP